MKTMCNPMNLSYRYQTIKLGFRKSVNREGADPSLIVFNGKYYLFSSMSAGFWRSTDLHTWVYFQSRTLPIYDYAPDVRVIEDYLYFCASKRNENCPIYRSKNPESDQFEEISRSFAFWDPNLFQDDDGRVFLYWGCSNKYPIWGVEMDTDSMMPIGEKSALIQGNPQEHGWERRGNNNEIGNYESKTSKIFSFFFGTDPYIEGAWMTKYGGRYYLQYAAPGTEFNIYADGVYVSDNPLGPFDYPICNPMSQKGGGFITGAGHGSTIQDLYGNWWHISSMRISVNHIFERRLGLFPAGFDNDGFFFCNTNFADYPMYIPDRKVNPWNDLFTGWMLLSYKKPVIATSSLKTHEPENAVDENIRTCWVAGTPRSGESLTVDLEKIQDVYAIQINFADYKVKSPRWDRNGYAGVTGMKRHIDTEAHLTRYSLESSTDGLKWFMLEDKRNSQTDFSHDYLAYDTPQKIRYIRITGYEFPYHSWFALSGLRVFGKGEGSAPPSTEVQGQRIDTLTARISWSPIIQADGYNIRYGPTPNKLYLSWMVYENNTQLLGTLNKGVDYYAAVDTFNANGITRGTPIKIE